MKNSKFKLQSLSQLRAKINQVIVEKHKTTLTTYNLKVIDEIIYNEPTKIVAVFKDYLILDDSSEFLRRLIFKYLL